MGNALVQDISVGDPHQPFLKEEITPVKRFGVVVASDGYELTAGGHEFVFQGLPSLCSAFFQCGVVRFIHIAIQDHSIKRLAQSSN